MSTVSQSSDTPNPPSSETLHRLAVEAGKYLDLNTCDRLPTEEVIAQGEANGYTEKEVQALLVQEGYASAEDIPVPPQGDAFSELWRAHRTPQALFSPEVQSFREWQAERQENRCTEYDDGTYQHPVEHAYSLHKARKRTSRAKDVGRHFIEEYDTFTTVVVTYCAEKGASEPIHQHADKFYPAALSRTRWNIFNRQIDTEEWAGVRLLAPEKPAASTPTPVFTHAHSVYWVAGHHSREDFAPLRDTFLREVEGATAEMNPIEKMIQVEHHTSAEVAAHPSVKREDLDAERGPTTGASGEVAANLPLLRARNALRERDASQEEWATADARDCPDWVEVWAAHLCCGADGNPRTSGVSRWGTFGNFTEIADSMKQGRETEPESKSETETESVKAGVGAQESGEEHDSPQSNPTPSVDDSHLSTTEREFVAAYLDAGAPAEREVIESNIGENIDELGGIARTDILVETIQARVGGG